MSAASITVQADRLRSVAETIISGMGSTPPEASEVANHLIEANLRGHDSHGVGMLPRYMENFKAGRLRPNQHAKIVRHDGLFAIFEGNMGFGQVIARETMDWAIETARKDGVAIYGLREVQHIGRVGTYGEQAVAAGMIAISFVKALSDPPYVAPFGGSDGRLATNPVTIAMPGKDKDSPIVLDFATSAVAMGKVRVAHNKQVEMADGILIDKRGQPTNDPGVLYPDKTQGAIMPLGGHVGGHKGYGLALVCELLAGALVGGGTYKEGQVYNRGNVNAVLGIVFDPARINDVSAFHDELSSVVDFVKASPASSPDSPVLVAGEPERIARKKRLGSGIEVDINTWRDIESAAAKVGIDAGAIEKIAGVAAVRA